MKKILLALALLCAVPAAAQNTRANLTVYNNSTFTNCGTGCISGKSINIWNAALISSLGFLNDTNVWTGSNTFLGPVNFGPNGNATSGIYPAQNYGSCTWDAAHDSSACVNTAIGAATIAGGGTVLLPPGNLYWANPVTIKTGIRLVGAGALATKILCDTHSLPCIGNVAADQLAGIGLTDFSIYPYSSASAGTRAIYLSNMQHSEIARLRIENFYDLTAKSGTAIWLGGVRPTNFVDTNLSLGFVNFNNVHDNTLIGCYDCFVANGYFPPFFPNLNPAMQQGITQNIFSNNNIWYVFNKGFVFRNFSNGNVLVGGVVELNANGAQAYVQSDDPQFSQQPHIVSGGSGFTPNGQGTATYTGGGCSVPPVMNVAANSSGVLTLTWGVATPGVCSVYPTASSAWSFSSGLGSGSSASLSLINAPINAYTQINSFEGVTETATAGKTGQCIFGGGFSYGTSVDGFITDQYTGNGNSGSNVVNCMTGGQSIHIKGTMVDASVGNIPMSELNVGMAYRQRTAPVQLSNGGTYTVPVGFDNVYVTNQTSVVAQTINLPCNPNDGTDISFSGTASGVINVSWQTLAGCVDPKGNAVATKYYGLPDKFASNTPVTLHYIGASNSWVLKAAGDTRNAVDNFGAVADTRLLKCDATTTGGAATISVANCVNYVTGVAVSHVFIPVASSGVSIPVPVGTPVIVNYAGAALTTAPIVSDSVSAHGSGYVTVPTIAIADATGSGGLFVANMELNSASVVHGGAGCTNGTQTFTLVGGTATTAATFTGTVSGGVLAGALTPVIGGSYQHFREPGNVLTPQSVQVSGPGCTSPPFVSATFDVASVTMISGGQNYTAPTAVFSDGSATLANPTIGTPVAKPWTANIASVTDDNNAVLDATAGTALAGTSVFVLIGGTDNTTAIQTALNVLPSPGTAGSGVYVSSAPPGYCYGISSSVAMPNSYPIAIRGEGQAASVICATKPMSAMLTKGSTFMTVGSTIQDLSLDGEKVATTVFSGACNTAQKWTNVVLRNPAPYGTNFQIGDGVSNCAGGTYVAVKIDNDSHLYSAHYDLPLVGVHVQNTDTAWYDLEVYETSNLGVWNDTKGAGMHMTNPHVFSYDRVSTCYWLYSNQAILTASECDRATNSAIDVSFGHNEIIGGYVNQSDTPYFGVNVAPSLTSVNVTGFDANFTNYGPNRVFWQSPMGANNTAVNNPGAWPEFAPGVATALCQGANNSAVTQPANTTENVMVDCPIPPGILGLNGKLEISVGWSMTGSGTGDLLQIKVGNPTTALSAAPTLSYASKSSGAYVSLTNFLNWQAAGSNNIQIAGLASTIGFNNVALTQTGVDLTATQDLLLTTTNSAGDSAIARRWTVILTPSN